MVVAVFGAAFLDPDGPEYSAARDLGARIANMGWIVATGGYAGAMEAASRGAAEAGGQTVGVTCRPLTRSGRRTNPWVKEEIPTPTVRERLVTLVRMADAAVALDGGIGTLTEIAFCWMQIQTGELSPRPLVLLGTVWHETFATFFRAAGEYLRGEERALLIFSSSPEDALRQISVFFSSRKNGIGDKSC
jgi:uncharacterized protein (TIGR00730 family)